jgi:hypothetical protein
LWSHNIHGISFSLPTSGFEIDLRLFSHKASSFTVIHQKMSTPEESPAQRAARLRRERREAKIKEGGSARLDKITSLSGRTPQSGKVSSL